MLIKHRVASRKRPKWGREKNSNQQVSALTGTRLLVLYRVFCNIWSQIMTDNMCTGYLWFWSAVSESKAADEFVLCDCKQTDEGWRKNRCLWKAKAEVCQLFRGFSASSFLIWLVWLHFRSGCFWAGAPHTLTEIINTNKPRFFKNSGNRKRQLEKHAACYGPTLQPWGKYLISVNRARVISFVWLTDVLIYISYSDFPLRIRYLAIRLSTLTSRFAIISL